MVKRYDESALCGIEITPQGFAKVKLRATRTGVLRYRRADGSLSLELRAPEEVFRPESMTTLDNVPMTNDHPTENGQGTLVNIGNATSFLVGYTAAPTYIEENRYLATSGVFVNNDAIADIKSGKTQVSAGYTCDLVEDQGTFEGEPYNARQINIVYNHVAIVDRGRAGPDVCIKLDAGDGVEEAGEDKEEKKTVVITLGDKEFEVSDELGQAFAQFMQDISDKTSTEDDDDDNENMTTDDGEGGEKKEPKEEKDPPKDKTDTIDALRAKVDHLEAANRKLNKKLKVRADSLSGELLHQKVLERVNLLKVAKALVSDKDAHTKMDSLADMQIKRLVILADDPGAKAKLEGASAVYINGRFDQIASQTAKSRKIHSDLGRDLAESTKTDADSTAFGSKVEHARAAARERLNNAWKKA